MFITFNCSQCHGKAEAEIVLRFPNLKKVKVVPLPGQGSTLKTMTFDEFKKKFGQK